MSSKNLGRGIEALISSNVEDKVKEKNDPGVNYIKVSDVRPNPNQPRRNFDSKALIVKRPKDGGQSKIMTSYFLTTFFKAVFN